MSNEVAERPMSFGEQLVGITFNPSGDEAVTKAKQLSAELADIVQTNWLDNHVANGTPYSALKTQLYDNAVHKIIDAQMAVVKLLTFKY